MTLINLTEMTSSVVCTERKFQVPTKLIQLFGTNMTSQHQNVMIHITKKLTWLATKSKLWKTLFFTATGTSLSYNFVI